MLIRLRCFLNLLALHDNSAFRVAIKWLIGSNLEVPALDSVEAAETVQFFLLKAARPQARRIAKEERLR
jgi:hypothetical protein